MYRRVLLASGMALGLLAPIAGAQNSTSSTYRLGNALPASVAAETQSPTYATQITGGSGVPVGIAVSDGASVVAGPGSAPAGEFIFEDEFEQN